MSELREQVTSLLEDDDRWTIDTNEIVCALDTLQRKWTLSDTDDRHDLQTALDIVEAVYRYVTAAPGT